MQFSVDISPHILIVEARFYEDIADTLVKGAADTLTDAQCTYERMQVPGALELPAAIKTAIKSMELYGGESRFHGFVALGCVIRGETSHFDHVCTGAMQGLQQLALEYSLALGNGVITADSREQALARAGGDKGNKGRSAAEACLAMLKLKDRFGLLRD